MPAEHYSKKKTTSLHSVVEICLSAKELKLLFKCFHWNLNWFALFISLKHFSIDCNVTADLWSRINLFLSFHPILNPKWRLLPQKNEILFIFSKHCALVQFFINLFAQFCPRAPSFNLVWHWSVCPLRSMMKANYQSRIELVQSTQNTYSHV